MSKALGKDINQFYNEGFPKGWFIEGQIVDYDALRNEQGKLILDPNEKYELKEFGYFVPEEDQGKEKTFESAFKKWMKARTHAILLIEIPIDQVDEAVKLLQSSFPKAKVK